MPSRNNGEEAHADASTSKCVGHPKVSKLPSMLRTSKHRRAAATTVSGEGRLLLGPKPEQTISSTPEAVVSVGDAEDISSFPEISRLSSPDASDEVEIPGPVVIVAAGVQVHESRNPSGTTQASGIATSRTETSRPSTPGTSTHSLSICEAPEQTSAQEEPSDVGSPDRELSAAALNFLSSSPVLEASSIGDGDEPLVPSGIQLTSPEEPEAEAEAISEPLASLQELLEQQESLNQGFRLQLVEREDEVDSLKEKIRTVQRERDMFESESDATSQQLQEMQRELRRKDEQLAEEKAKVETARRQVEGARRINNFEGVQQLQATLNELVEEREELNRQLAESTRNEQRAEAWNETLRQDFIQVHKRVDDLNNLVSELEQQIQQQKDTAEARIEELQGHVKTLQDSFVPKYMEDPKDSADPFICQPNELRDLRQAFEMSQAKCAQVIDDNSNLAKEIESQKKEISRLRDGNELLKDTNMRLSSSFEIMKSKLDNFMATIPQIVKLETGKEIEEVPGLQEQLAESAWHEEQTGVALKEKDLEASGLRKEISRLGREKSSELEALKKRMEELQERAIRLDEANFALTMRSDDAEKEISQVKEQLRNSQDQSGQWRMQCERQAFGPSVDVVRKHHSDEIQLLSDRIEGLMCRMQELSSGREMAEEDLGLFKIWAATKMAGIRELGRWCDWYQVQNDALRARFHAELQVKPLDIPFKSTFWDLTSEQQQHLLQGEDNLIEFFTGINLGRGGEPIRPANLDSGALWTRLVQEYQTHKEAQKGQEEQQGQEGPEEGEV